MVTAALDKRCDLLDLEAVEVDFHRGSSPLEPRLRLFGGQVAAQALVAAGRTVADGAGVERPVHFLHACCLCPGDPKVLILSLVDRIRDGRSFTTRRAAAIQPGEAMFHLLASFRVPEGGVSHQQLLPEAPDPKTCRPGTT
jgi:acyl-CoA thioesterase-2